MADSHYIAITVRYEPHGCGRSLAWIAPGLRHEGLLLVEDRLDHPGPTRTWAGFVKGQTFERFSRDWLLEREEPEWIDGEAADRDHAPGYTRTFDGMNWEIDGISPIISVSVMVVHPLREQAAHRGP